MPDQNRGLSPQPGSHKKSAEEKPPHLKNNLVINRQGTYVRYLTDVKYFVSLDVFFRKHFIRSRCELIVVRSLRNSPLLYYCRTYHTETDGIVITKIGVGELVVVARHGTVLRRAVPATAKVHTITTGAEIPPTPFLHITAHVVQAKFVRFLSFDFMSFTTGIIFIPSNFVYYITSGVSILSTEQFVTATSSIWPFIGVGNRQPFAVKSQATAFQLVEFS